MYIGVDFYMLGLDPALYWPIHSLPAEMIPRYMYYDLLSEVTCINLNQQRSLWYITRPYSSYKSTLK